MTFGPFEQDDAAGTIPAIDCTEFVVLVDNLVQSDPRDWSAIVRKHLDECPPCLVYLQQMLDLRVLLSHVFDGEKLTGEQVEGVLAAINAMGRNEGR
jgi:hypothetical protein